MSKQKIGIKVPFLTGPEYVGKITAYSQEEIDFLDESNLIEGVRDRVSFNDALYAWDFCKSQDVLSMDVILKTHAILMKNQKIPALMKGRLRIGDCYIGGRKAPPDHIVERLLFDWIFKVGCISIEACNSVGYNREVESQRLHVAYEFIHPFIDGNGRTGRIFMNWIRIKKLGLPIW